MKKENNPVCLKRKGFAFDGLLIEHVAKVIDGHWRYKTVTDFIHQAILEKLDREEHPNVKSREVK